MEASGRRHIFLTGTYELTIDAKNRLSIPFAIRRKLNPDTHGHSFYAVPGRRRGTLSLYPEKYYEEMRADLPPDDALSEEAYEFRQFEYSQSALLDPDAQGRVLIPERMLRRAGLEREVVLIAVRDHLELWRKEDFEEFERRHWENYHQQRARAVQEQLEVARSGRPETG